jgi:hypothetical protein
MEPSTHAWGPDPDHPIINRPWEYDIVALHLECASVSSEGYLDLTLRRGREERVLRFWSPRDLEIIAGGLSSLEMVVLDVSGRQLDGISVRVDSYEGAPGTLRFAARTVEDLDAGPVRYDLCADYIARMALWKYRGGEKFAVIHEDFGLPKDLVARLDQWIADHRRGADGNTVASPDDRIAAGRSIAAAVAEHLGSDAIVYLFDERRKTFALVTGTG